MTDSIPKAGKDDGLTVAAMDDHHARPLMDKMERTLLALASMSENAGFRRRRRLPPQWLRLSIVALEAFDMFLDHNIRELQRKGWQTYCGPGCASCCLNMPAGVSAWELLLIYQELWRQGELHRYFRRSLERDQLLCTLLPGKHANESNEISAGARDRAPAPGSDETLSAYARARVGCAFLDDSRQCAVYSRRPLVCRMHYGFTPPEWCDPDHPKFGQAVRFNFHPHERVRQALARLDTSLGLEAAPTLAAGFVTLAVNVLKFEPLVIDG